MAEFEVFKSFYFEEDAMAMLNLLCEKGLESRIEKKRSIADKIFVGDGSEAEIYLMLKGPDFSKANFIIDEQVEQNLSALEPDYYLFSFSDEELLDIIKRPDEWNNQDVIIARKILTEKGHNISDREKEQVKYERLMELARPDREKFTGLFLGYFLAVFVCIYGLFFALTRLTAKKVLPDGTKMLIYDQRSRDHFVAMIVISALLLFSLFMSQISYHWIRTGIYF